MSLGSLVFVFHIILKTWLILYEGLLTHNKPVLIVADVSLFFACSDTLDNQESLF